VTPTTGAEAPAASGTKLYEVPALAMEPTIRHGQRVRVAVFERNESVRPAVGSIVVSHPPRGAGDLAVVRDGVPRCAVPRAVAGGMPCPRPTGGRWSDEVYVLRIVAGPGDTVAIRDGHVVRNGEPVDEPYVAPTCTGPGHATGVCTLPRPIRLPPNRYFLMGDSRGESSDSRVWGPVPRAWMVGAVTEIGAAEPTPSD
jgi:signal peptidase I